MTRKDYVAVAADLRVELELEGGSRHGRELVRGIAQRLAETFAQEDPRFDRARFMSAVLS